VDRPRSVPRLQQEALDHFWGDRASRLDNLQRGRAEA